MNTRNFMAALVLTSTILSSGTASAHGLGPIDCNDWYKNPFVAVICGVGAVVSAPFELMDYLDRKELKRIGITRKESGNHNKYEYKKMNLNFAVFDLRRHSLSDAENDCASIDGRLANSSEIEIISKGGKADADILFGTLLIARNEKGSATEVYLTGWASDHGDKDIFLIDQSTKAVTYHSHQEIVEKLNSSAGNESRSSFDDRGILTPVCITK